MRARRCGSVGEAWVQATKVFLNGRWIGAHRAPDELKKALLKLRRSVSISEDVSVVYDHSLNELRLNNDWGRVCRPLYVVDECSINLTKGEIRELKARPALPAAARGTWLERAAAPPPHARDMHAHAAAACVLWNSGGSAVQPAGAIMSPSPSVCVQFGRERRVGWQW